VLRQEIAQLHNAQGWSTPDLWHQVRVRRIPQGGVPSRDSDRQYVCVRSVLDAFGLITPAQLKKRLSVEFSGQEGEVGMDYGALTSNMYREFWSIALDPKSPVQLFEGPGELKLPHPDSSCADLKVVGKLMMKSLYDMRPLPRGLAPSLYKGLLGVVPNADDWHWYDKQQATMMRRMVALPGATRDWDGVTFEMVGGADTALTEENKLEFYTRRVQYELIVKREAQLTALREGFREAQEAIGLCNHMSLLTYSDLRLLAHGPEHVKAPDIVDLLTFEGQPQMIGRAKGHLISVLNAMLEDDLRRFLLFVTEFGSIPEGGLPRDNSTSAPGKIEVKVVADATGSAHRRPEAHTCFYELVLPDYESNVVMRRMLLEAFDSADGAGFQVA